MTWGCGDAELVEDAKNKQGSTVKECCKACVMKRSWAQKRRQVKKMKNFHHQQIRVSLCFFRDGFNLFTSKKTLWPFGVTSVSCSCQAAKASEATEATEVAEAAEAEVSQATEATEETKETKELEEIAESGEWSWVSWKSLLIVFLLKGTASTWKVSIKC